MVEFNYMPTAIITIVVIGIIIGIGVIVLDQFGVAVKTDAQVYNESITITSGAGNTANDDVTSVIFFANASNIIIENNQTAADSALNFSADGSIVVDVNDGSEFNISYIYDFDSPTTTAVFSSRDSTDDFVTWLPVIIIILAAAIILGLVMRSFKQ